MQVSSSGAITTTGVISGSNALSASYAETASAAASAVTAVTAQTSSFANAFTVAGNLTAQTLVVQTITSSVDFVTGSTRFGSIAANTHVFTGSVLISGSVGIGLSNPTNKLEVQAGDIKINANVSSTASLYFGITGTNYGKIQYDDSNQSMFITTVGSGFSGYDLNLGTKENIRLSILGSNGNVGIGTTNPSSKLDISGSVTVSGSLSIYGDGTFINRVSSGEPYLFFRKNGVNRGSIYGVEGGGLRIFDNNDVQVLTVTSSFVGIGVTNPPTRLHVAGAAGSAVPGATGIPSLGFANSSSVALFTNLDTNYGTLFGTLNTGVGWIQQQRVDGTGTAYNLSLQPNGGNVGIGITPQGAGSSKTLEIGSRGIIYDNNDNFLYGNNGWVDGSTWKYKQSGYACIMATNGGKFSFSTAASGTQNNAITWSEKFVIENGGNVIVNTGQLSVTNGALVLSGTASDTIQNSGTPFLYLSGGGSSYTTIQQGSSKMRWWQYNGSSWIKTWDIDYNGNATLTGTFTESSSIRYKTNIETIKYGLDKVLQLRGVTYDKKDTGIRELGLIAEEVNEILPDVVIKNEEGEPDSVSYGRLTAVLIEAVKDLQSQINELKAK
jgi:hypothetical protein